MGYFDDIRRFVLLIAFAGAAIPFGAWAVGAFAKWLQKTLSPPEYSVANVVTKRLEVKTKDNKKAHTIYYMTFWTQDKGRKEYEITAKAYALSAPGDTGELCQHMGRFVSFIVEDDAAAVSAR